MCDISDVTRGHQGIVPVVAVGFFPLFKQQRIAICTSESQGSEHCQKPCLGAPDRGSASLAGERCVRQQQVMFQNHLQKTAPWNRGAAIQRKWKGGCVWGDVCFDSRSPDGRVWEQWGWREQGTGASLHSPCLQGQPSTCTFLSLHPHASCNALLLVRKRGSLPALGRNNCCSTSFPKRLLLPNSAESSFYLTQLLITSAPLVPHLHRACTSASARRGAAPLPLALDNPNPLRHPEEKLHHSVRCGCFEGLRKKQEIFLFSGWNLKLRIMGLSVCLFSVRDQTAFFQTLVVSVCSLGFNILDW